MTGNAGGRQQAAMMTALDAERHKREEFNAKMAMAERGDLHAPEWESQSRPSTSHTPEPRRSPTPSAAPSAAARSPAPSAAASAKARSPGRAVLVDPSLTPA